LKKVKNISFTLKFLVVLFFAQGLTNKCAAQDVDYKAYTLFIYNFMKYIEWPEANSKGDFVLGILGDSPIYKELQIVAGNKKVKGHNIIVKYIKPEEAASCQMVYITSSKSSLVKALKEQMKDKPVLLVGEREGLAKKGAALSFVTLDDDALKFDINKKEIEHHQLKISSSLVSLGTVVN
jgi:hypothetical protein